MNPKILDLAKQADFHVSINGNEILIPDPTTEDITAAMKKFAELIVRECASIAYEYDAPKMSGPGMIIAGSIETHFGVEE